MNRSVMGSLFNPFTHEKLPYTAGLCELYELRFSFDIVHDKTILVEVGILECAHAPNLGETAPLEENRRLGGTKATYFSSFLIGYLFGVCFGRPACRKHLLKQSLKLGAVRVGTIQCLLLYAAEWDRPDVAAGSAFQEMVVRSAQEPEDTWPTLRSQL